MSGSLVNGQYFNTSNTDKYLGNQSADYSKNCDLFQRINAMLENTLDLSSINDSSNKRMNQDSQCSVVDLLGYGKQYSNVIPISGLNVSSGSLGSSGYLSGLSSCSSNTQNSPQPVRTYSYGNIKYPDVGSPLSKILSQSWTSSPTGNMRAIRAASPPMSYNADLSSPTLEQAILMGCESYRDNRSSSPTESDTSGISSVSELSNLSDLMNNLSLGTTVASQTSLGTGVTSPTLSNNISCRADIDLPLLSSPFFVDRRWSTSSANLGYNDLDSIERAARLHRNAAAFCEASCTWHGVLPARIYKNPTYSCKVFLGGVPWDITEVGLVEAFAQFGPIKVLWPGKEKNATQAPKPGYAYIIFETEKQVKALLQACTHDYSNGGSWYYKVSSRRMRAKDVQVIPWAIEDSNHVVCPSQRLDPNKTVFIGALHGMLNAKGLSQVMNDLFGGVVYAGIDTDKFKYPVGSGRLTFNNHKSYMKAITAAFVEVKTLRFTKKIQIDPYMEDAICSSCKMQQGPVFCRDLSCLRYYCRICWHWQHSVDSMKQHKPMMRNKSNR